MDEPLNVRHVKRLTWFEWLSATSDSEFFAICAELGVLPDLIGVTRLGADDCPLFAAFQARHAIRVSNPWVLLDQGAEVAAAADCSARFRGEIEEWSRSGGSDALLFRFTIQPPPFVRRSSPRFDVVRYYLSFPTPDDAFAWKMRWAGVRFPLA